MNWGVLALFACLTWPIAPGRAAQPDHGVRTMLERGYVNVGSGQLHYRRAQPARGTAPRRTVVLFHETPVSSSEYETLMRELARDRVVIAFDTPGFGMSDPISSAPVSIADYAKTMAAGIDALLANRDERVAVFGFHTGAFLALEVALLRPDRVDRLMLGGIPLRNAEERAERLAALPRDKGAAALHDRLEEYWQLSVVKHPPEVPPERAMQLFTDMVLGKHTYWWAYDAVWRYPAEERLASVRQPTLVLAPHEMLVDQTLRAARLIPGARVVEFPRLQHWVLELGAADFAREMRAFLDGDPRSGAAAR